jgi:NADPH:quinone reductase-like Zn-dependent oxidoreductase
MKALHARARGGPEQLIVEEAAQPQPAAGEALIRVCASGVSPTELQWNETWKSHDGRDRELPIIPGHELSGVVVGLGAGVRDVALGDEVYALTDFSRDGADAEYVAVATAALAPKPPSLSHAQAAAVPLSGLTAWQALFAHGQLRAGQRVLIHAAAGGVGTFAVQLARWRGAHVVGTGSAGNLGFLRDLGCDEVIDYHATPFEEVVRDCDLVLDLVGGDTQLRSLDALQPGGLLISLVGPVSPPAADEARARGQRAIFFIVEPDRTGLIELARLIEARQLRPIIADVLTLDAARQAFERGLAGHVRGKLVLQVASG